MCFYLLTVWHTGLWWPWLLVGSVWRHFITYKWVSKGKSAPPAPPALQNNKENENKSALRLLLSSLKDFIFLSQSNTESLSLLHALSQVPSEMGKIWQLWAVQEPCGSFLFTLPGHIPALESFAEHQPFLPLVSCWVQNQRINPKSVSIYALISHEKEWFFRASLGFCSK